jgi:hypothetical protein
VRTPDRNLGNALSFAAACLISLFLWKGKSKTTR